MVSANVFFLYMTAVCDVHLSDYNFTSQSEDCQLEPGSTKQHTFSNHSGSWWKTSLELIELSRRINKVTLVQVSSCSNTGSIRDYPYWTSRKNSLELIELSSTNKVSLVQVSSCSNTGSIRDDPYWTPGRTV